MVTFGGIGCQKKSKKLTPKELTSIKSILSTLPAISLVEQGVLAKNLDFEKQVTIILQVQYLLKKTEKTSSPTDKQVPVKKEDVLEKSLNQLGFATRQLQLSQMGIGQKNQTYEILEVKTQDGWLIVDKNHTWVGLSRNYCPISLEKLKNAQFKMDWLYPFPKELSIDLDKPFLFLIG